MDTPPVSATSINAQLGLWFDTSSPLAIPWAILPFQNAKGETELVEVRTDLDRVVMVNGAPTAVPRR